MCQIYVIIASQIYSVLILPLCLGIVTALINGLRCPEHVLGSISNKCLKCVFLWLIYLNSLCLLGHFSHFNIWFGEAEAGAIDNECRASCKS